MTIKEFIISRFQLFFFLVTLILIAEYVIGVFAAPDQVLHNKDLLGPVAAAGLCIIPTCVTYYKKEPTLKQYFVRLIIQLVLIETVMFIAANPDMGNGMSEAQVRIMIGAATFIIYVLAVLIMYCRNYRQSKALTSELKKFQSAVWQ